MLLTLTVFVFFFGGCLFFVAGGALDFGTRASCSPLVGGSPSVVGTCSVETGGRAVEFAGMVDDGTVDVTMARLVLFVEEVASAVGVVETVGAVET